MQQQSATCLLPVLPRLPLAPPLRNQPRVLPAGSPPCAAHAALPSPRVGIIHGIISPCAVVVRAALVPAVLLLPRAGRTGLIVHPRQPLIVPIHRRQHRHYQLRRQKPN